MSTKSLHAQESDLASTGYQLEVLNRPMPSREFQPFGERLAQIGLLPLRPQKLDILQINLGYMCNQTCSHCHVDAGPDRKEIMTKATMQACLDALDRSDIQTVDLTGGAPEMNPNFRWFVEQLFARSKRIIVRCNLTIIVANKKYHDLPEFFRDHQVEVVSSLPYFNARRTDSQRGEGVFEKSIRALKMLNAVGYGLPESPLKLDLVYNPSGAFLPAAQTELEAVFKEKLKAIGDISFHNLLAITNMPISRFLDYLLQSGNYEGYMQKLINAFNPGAAEQVMCRNTLSVGWDGRLFDCDFNQMLELGLADSAPAHIADFDARALAERDIVINQHCYGCTAGSGSSCGGALSS